MKDEITSDEIQYSSFILPPSSFLSGVTSDGVIELMGAGVIVHEKKSSPESEKQKPDAEKQKPDAEKQKSDAELKQKSLTKPKPKPKLPSTQLQESETKSKPAKPIKRKFNFVVK